MRWFLAGAVLTYGVVIGIIALLFGVLWNASADVQECVSAVLGLCCPLGGWALAEYMSNRSDRPLF